MATILLAQNITVYDGDGGHPYAHTGGISCQIIKDAGAMGIIAGHMEIADQPDVVNKKLRSALKSGMRNCILMVGEKWEELGADWDIASVMQKETAKAAVRIRLMAALEEVSLDDFRNLVLAYDPAWGSRGSGNGNQPPTPEQIEDMCAFLRTEIGDKYGAEAANSVRIVYGGTMSPERADVVMSKANVDGFILGSAGTTCDWVAKIGSIVEKFAKPGRRAVLVLNWKAYLLKEPYAAFMNVLGNYEFDSYVAPNFVDLRLVSDVLARN